MGGSFQNLTIGERAAAHLYSTFLHWRSVWRSLPLLSRTYIDRIGESDSKLFQHKYVPQILKAGSVGRSYLVKKYRVGWCTLMDVCNYIKWMNGGCFEFWGHDELKLLTLCVAKPGGPPLLKSVIKEGILFKQNKFCIGGECLPTRTPIPGFFYLHTWRRLQVWSTYSRLE